MPADAGAVAREAFELDFGDAPGEAAAALQEDCIFPLTQLGCLLVQGADADAFLQGQLSNDVAGLKNAQAQLSSYNSPKGRVLALLGLTRGDAGIRVEISADLVASVQKRLRMYVLRAKVQLNDASASLPELGLSGPNAAEWLSRNELPVPATDWDVAERGAIRIVRRPGAIDRFTLQAPAAELAALWRNGSSQLRPCGTAAWRLLDILAGLPSIGVATQEHFVAQMLNLDLLGGISFRKGCYPGQEVVARLHYLGTLKRRMLRAYVSGPAAPGDAVYAADGDGQAVGEVVSAAPHPQHGTALLIVLQLQAATSPLRLGSSEGVAVTVDSTSVPATDAS